MASACGRAGRAVESMKLLQEPFLTTENDGYLFIFFPMLHTVSWLLNSLRLWKHKAPPASPFTYSLHTFVLPPSKGVL